MRVLLAALVVSFVGGVALAGPSGVVRDEELRTTFEERYGAWREWMAKYGYSSNSTKFFECDEFRNIVNMGLPVLPLIVEKIGGEEQGARWLGEAVRRITKVKFRAERREDGRGYVFEEFPGLKPGENVWLRWWKEGRRRTPQRFEKLCKEWKELRAQGKEEEAWEKYQRIRDLGIVALPCIMEKVEADEGWLIPALSYLTDNAVKPYAGPDECAAWWKQNRGNWTIPEEVTPEPERK